MSRVAGAHVAPAILHRVGEAATAWLGSRQHVPLARERVGGTRAVPPTPSFRRAHGARNVTAAGFLGPKLTVCAGYARGLEESGVAPDNAVNRNQPLPAILTSQVDGGIRYALSNNFKLVAGAFELCKPYYNLDAGNRYGLLGDVVSRGVELSASGTVTPRLNIVAGGVLLRPQVTGEGVALGRVGKRPVGLPRRLLDLNADWRPPRLDGWSLDTGVSHTGPIVATQRCALKSATPATCTASTCAARAPMTLSPAGSHRPT